MKYVIAYIIFTAFVVTLFLTGCAPRKNVVCDPSEVRQMGGRHVSHYNGTNCYEFESHITCVAPLFRIER